MDNGENNLTKRIRATRSIAMYIYFTKVKFSSKQSQYAVSRSNNGNDVHLPARNYSRTHRRTLDCPYHLRDRKGVGQERTRT